MTPDELEATLSQLDGLFAQSQAIARVGRDAFFARDFVLRNAAVGVIVRLGEAAKALPESYVVAHPKVRYRALVRMRDAVAHRYDTIDSELVWRAIDVLHPEDAAAHGSRLTSS